MASKTYSSVKGVISSEVDGADQAKDFAIAARSAGRAEREARHP